MLVSQKENWLIAKSSQLSSKRWFARAIVRISSTMSTESSTPAVATISFFDVFISEGLTGHYTKGLKWTREAIERVPNADGDEGNLLSVDAEPTSSVEQRNESKVTEAFANFDRYSIASK